MILLAQTDPLITEGLSAWGKLAQDYGLGVMLAGFIAAALVFLMKNMMRGHRTDMDNMLQLVNKRDETLDNHLGHVTEAIDGLTIVVGTSAGKQESSIDKLISAQTAENREHRGMIDRLATEQRHSTEMVREIIENKLGRETD